MARRGEGRRRFRRIQQHCSSTARACFNEDHVRLFDDVFNRLIDEIESKARAELSHRLAPLGNAPGELIRPAPHGTTIFRLPAPSLRQSRALGPRATFWKIAEDQEPSAICSPFQARAGHRRKRWTNVLVRTRQSRGRPYRLPRNRGAPSLRRQLHNPGGEVRGRRRCSPKGSGSGPIFPPPLFSARSLLKANGGGCNSGCFAVGQTPEIQAENPPRAGARIERDRPPRAAAARTMARRKRTVCHPAGLRGQLNEGKNPSILPKPSQYEEIDRPGFADLCCGSNRTWWTGLIGRRATPIRYSFCASPKAGDGPPHAPSWEARLGHQANFPARGSTGRLFPISNGCRPRPAARA